MSLCLKEKEGSSIRSYFYALHDSLAPGHSAPHNLCKHAALDLSRRESRETDAESDRLDDFPGEETISSACVCDA